MSNARDEYISQAAAIVIGAASPAKKAQIVFEGLNKLVAELKRELNSPPIHAEDFNQLLLSVGCTAYMFQHLHQLRGLRGQKNEILGQLAKCYFLIGYVFRLNDCRELAKSHMEQALEWYNQCFPQGHIEILCIYNYIADICLELNDDAQAVKHLHLILECAKNLQIEINDYVCESYLKLHHIFKKDGSKSTEADEYLKKYEALKKQLGVNSPDQTPGETLGKTPDTTHSQTHGRTPDGTSTATSTTAAVAQVEKVKQSRSYFWPVAGGLAAAAAVAAVVVYGPPKINNS